MFGIYQAVLNMVKSFLDYPEEKNDMVYRICKASADIIKPHLKEGFIGTEDKVVYVMAALAIYRYALIRGCQEDSFDSLKAGDITVSRSASSLLEFAEKLLYDAVQNADCIEDTSFIFRGV